jgi:hypothetical protein
VDTVPTENLELENENACDTKSDEPKVIEDYIVFQDRRIAIEVRETMLSINTLLNRSAQTVNDSLQCSTAEKHRYRKINGSLMHIALYDIFKPICEEHPDLMPEEFRPGRS